MGTVSMPEPRQRRRVPGSPRPASTRHDDARLIHAVLDTAVEESPRQGAEPDAVLIALAKRCVELHERVEQLQTALDSRVIIEQAKGVLAERHGLSVDSAFEVLRGHARRNNLRIHDLARAVVDGHDLTARRSATG